MTSSARLGGKSFLTLADCILHWRWKKWVSWWTVTFTHTQYCRTLPAFTVHTEYTYVRTYVQCTYSESVSANCQVKLHVGRQTRPGQRRSRTWPAEAEPSKFAEFAAGRLQVTSRNINTRERSSLGSNKMEYEARWQMRWLLAVQTL